MNISLYQYQIIQKINELSKNMTITAYNQPIFCIENAFNLKHLLAKSVIFNYRSACDINSSINTMIDRKGYRLNVGIILVNSENQVFWGKRVANKNAWQFPQGGVNSYETLKETMFRELNEEVGLYQEDVEIIATTRRWLYYKLPPHMQRHSQVPLCIGQKQKWFLLRLISDVDKIRFDLAAKPEFKAWRWVDYWYPINEVIYFKRDLYRKVLTEFEPVLFQKNISPIDK